MPCSSTHDQQEGEDLAPDGGVEADTGSSATSSSGLERHGAGDDDPLALTARELVRVAQEEPLGRAQAARATAPRRPVPPRRRAGRGCGCPRRRPRRSSGGGSARRSGPGTPSARRRRRPSSRAGSRSGGPAVEADLTGGGLLEAEDVPARVVLPQPDSPTRASDLARGGRRGRRRRRHGPGRRRSAKCDPEVLELEQGVAHRTPAGAPGARTHARPGAGRRPHGGHSAGVGSTSQSHGPGVGTPGVERAAGRQAGGSGGSPPRPEGRTAVRRVTDGRERRGQRPGVGVHGRREDLRRWAFLDDAARRTSRPAVGRRRPAPTGRG